MFYEKHDEIALLITSLAMTNLLYFPAWGIEAAYFYAIKDTADSPTWNTEIYPE